MQSNQSLRSLLVQDFYESHQSWLHKWLSRKLGSSFDAADLTQDTFLKVLLKDKSEEVVEPRAYLTRIAHGLMVNFLRRRDLENAYLAALATLGGSQSAQSSVSPETYLLTLEKIIALDDMLNGLPTKVRTAFLLHRIDGMAYAEIAEELGVTASSVKKYVARALLHCAASE